MIRWRLFNGRSCSPNSVSIAYRDEETREITSILSSSTHPCTANFHRLPAQLTSSDAAHSMGLFFPLYLEQIALIKLVSSKPSAH